MTDLDSAPVRSKLHPFTTQIELAILKFPYESWGTPFQQLKQVVDEPSPQLPADTFSPEFVDFSSQCLRKKPDVKPSNVLINTQGQVKMCDFGISGQLVDSVAKTLDAGCKPYMAGDVWICMELMDTSLDKFYKKVIEKGMTIPEDILGKITVAIVKALEHLHNNLSVIHRVAAPPRDLDSKACVTIGDKNFVVKADDLEQIEELGRGAYGVVDKMRHVPSGVIMAVK
ncbi:hypothetical protein CRUP_002178, partial [Coryphaenoides rupestris]